MYVYKFEAFLSKEECVQDPDPTELDTQSHIFSITQHHSDEKNTFWNTKARSNEAAAFFECIQTVFSLFEVCEAVMCIRYLIPIV